MMAPNTPEVSFETLAKRFEQFGRRETVQSSPLYTRLSLGIANDPELLALATHARAGQPVPNLLLAAVHFLLLKGLRHSLAAFYPSVSGASRASGDPYPYFRSFCLEHQGEIRMLIAHRLVQTNEIRRCACLLPAFGIAARQGREQPLALVEIGASAGLNLLWERYGYDYGKGRQYGSKDSPIQIAGVLRGDQHPPFPATWPQVAFRIGLDLNPIDLYDPEAILWLRALIWPEHTHRADLLQRAVRFARKDPPPLIAGDALALLPATLATIPRKVTLCVFHSFAINQFSPAARERLASLLAEQGARRDLFHISMEALHGGHPALALVSWQQGVRIEQRLAQCESHGEWLKWMRAD
jgi:hypothetical protein